MEAALADADGCKEIVHGAAKALGGVAQRLIADELVAVERHRAGFIVDGAARGKGAKAVDGQVTGEGGPANGHAGAEIGDGPARAESAAAAGARVAGERAAEDGRGSFVEDA